MSDYPQSSTTFVTAETDAVRIWFRFP